MAYISTYVTDMITGLNHESIKGLDNFAVWMCTYHDVEFLVTWIAYCIVVLIVLLIGVYIVWRIKPEVFDD